MQIIFSSIVSTVYFAVLLSVTVADEPQANRSPVSEMQADQQAFRTFAHKTYMKIHNALLTQGDFDIDQVPFDKVMKNFSDDYGIPIRIDVMELEKFGIGFSTPLTLHMPSMNLRSALNVILSPLNLDYVYRDEVLYITSKSAALTTPLTLLYKIQTTYSNHDVAELISRTSESLTEDGYPNPIVYLLSPSDADTGEQHLFVRANKRTHEDIQSTLELLHQQNRK